MNSTATCLGAPPSPQVIYERLFDFIDDVLPLFTIKSEKTNGIKVDAEDAITEDLENYLNDKQETLKQDRNTAFRFTNQSSQGTVRTDIGVRFGRGYNGDNRIPFCWIEAKRLTTLTDKNRDEREYVFVCQEKVNGKKKYKGNGGIQRFKENKHAPNLPYSVMIGYIQKNDAAYWFNKVNNWIKDLINVDASFWTTDDCLKRYCSKKTIRFTSVHRRKDNTNITLHHFWIDMQ